MKVEILVFNIIGAKTHFKQEIWVESSRYRNGGYYRTINKKYDVPRVTVNFKARVNVLLKIGGIYTDGKNKFMAVGYDEIVCFDHDIISFSIPEKLECISSIFSEM